LYYAESGKHHGTYYSLTPGHPNEIDEATAEQLQKESIFFEDLSLDRFAFVSGVSSDWPAGRGCWINDEKTVSIWIGEEDHIKVIAWTRSRYVNKAHKLCRAVMDDLETALLQIEALHITDRGSVGWAILPEIGFVAARPRNCGTGMGASIKLFLPRLFVQTAELDNVCRHNGVTHWRDENPRSALRGQVVLGAVQAMGLSELKMLSNLYVAVGALKAEERRLHELSNREKSSSMVEPRSTSNLTRAGARATLGSRQRDRSILRRQPSRHTKQELAEAIEAVATRVAYQAIQFGLRCARDPYPHEHAAATRIQSVFRGSVERRRTRQTLDRTSDWNASLNGRDTERLGAEQVASQIQAKHEKAVKLKAHPTKKRNLSLITPLVH
jgi:hypothetical protein